MDRPAGARELADILGLDEHTVAKYLRTLGKLNLVVRTRHRGGYRLVPDRQDLFGGDLTVNKLQLEPVNTAGHIVNNQYTEGLLIAVVDQDPHKQTRRGEASHDSVEVLRSLGIGEPKRSALARLAYVTPEYIRTWHAHLGHVKDEAYRPGLLIHVLETGDPAPEVSENGHPLDCECSKCAPLICPQCNIRPCDCE